MSSAEPAPEEPAPEPKRTLTNALPSHPARELLSETAEHLQAASKAGAASRTTEAKSLAGQPVEGT